MGEVVAEVAEESNVLAALPQTHRVLARACRRAGRTLLSIFGFLDAKPVQFSLVRASTTIAAVAVLDYLDQSKGLYDTLGEVDAGVALGGRRARHQAMAAAGARKADAAWSGATTPRLSSCAWRPRLCDDEPICEMRESLTIRRSG